MLNMQMRRPCETPSPTKPRLGSQAGFTLIDNLVAVAIVAVFFGALYSVCGQCMGMLGASRDLNNVEQYSQFRVEQLRKCTWAQITDSTYLRTNVFNTTQSSSLVSGKVTETLTVNAFPTAVSPAIQISRPPNGPASTVSVGPAVAAADLAQVNLVLSWASRRGAPTRSINTTIIVSRN
ncbi:MAG: hypothetical protein QOE70_5636 [Chthoniobacter sp.]|jgi:Tfp pilus assembly protein PilV|nr:hypothetical protein [Chthoniobacter sp.]